MKNSLICLMLSISASAFSETTLELLQQRAEAGDATAQTFLGMAYQYGCAVSPDPEKALEWFGKAADQGDEFAAKRRDLWGQPIRTVIRTQKESAFLSSEDLQKKIAQGQSAPYAGSISWDDLVLHRDQYVGKVVELDFTIIAALGISTPYVYVRDPQTVGRQSGPSDKLYLDGEDALKWRLEIERKYPGAVSTVYALIEKDKLIGLGARQRKDDDGYSYRW